MISQSAKEISWTEKMRKVWRSELQMEVAYTYLHSSLSEEYKWEINDNGIAYQICLIY